MNWNLPLSDALRQQSPDDERLKGTAELWLQKDCLFRFSLFIIRPCLKEGTKKGGRVGREGGEGAGAKDKAKAHFSRRRYLSRGKL